MPLNDYTQEDRALIDTVHLVQHNFSVKLLDDLLNYKGFRYLISEFNANMI